MKKVIGFLGKPQSLIKDYASELRNKGIYLLIYFINESNVNFKEQIF